MFSVQLCKMTKELYLFNTLTHKKDLFVPIDKSDDPIVTMYSCGPTVYSHAHIGNMRAAVFADILRRTIKFAGYKLKSVMNITDVGHLTDDADSGDDKMEVGAKRENLTVWDVAKKYSDIYFSDTKKLNIINPDIICKATDYIDQQIEYVRKLEEYGFTYTTDDGVYFDTLKLADYGKMAGLDINGLEAGKRVSEGLEQKKNKCDFALWKFSPKTGAKRQMEWNSPWGIGFPGWHIECSVMSYTHLGFPFDIHTGGIDHIPVHHTNEIAQNEAIFKGQTVNYWIHNNHLQLASGKMSKSLGNVVTISSIEEHKINPIVLRYLFLLSHYRAEMKFSWAILEDAERSYNRIISKISKCKESSNELSQVIDVSKLSEKGKQFVQKLDNVLLDDMGTAAAIVILRELIDSDIEGNEKIFIIGYVDTVLGLNLLNSGKNNDSIPAEIIEIANLRKQAKDNKDYTKSDELRSVIKNKGYSIMDNTDGTFTLSKL